jgi:hypothetical protein
LAGDSTMTKFLLMVRPLSKHNTVVYGKPREKSKIVGL